MAARLAKTEVPAYQPGSGPKEAPSEKREAILAAALDLFVERGFYGTAVPEIADRAKVGAGTIYRYFESKEALVNSIYRLQKTAFGHAVIDNMPVTVSTREMFRTMWMRMAEFASKNLNAFVFMELHHHAQYLDKESRTLEDQMLALFTSVLQAAQSRGDIKVGPPHLLMGIVMGAFTGVIRSCVDETKPPTKADWELAEQILWEAVRS
ncbi:MAG TPA: TetR/AcrR family transcriptional regulator [Kofleriaceae bacterium]|jgi:AcrR family transcriptional regulator